MALTEIPIELSSTPSIVDGGNATAITIDSSENVTLAGSLTATSLHAHASTNTAILIEGDTGAGATFINFADGVPNTKAQISGAKVGGSGGRLIFSTNNSSGTLTEHMRIEAAGQVTMPLQPAFSVVPATTQSNIAINSYVTIVLGSETFDVGANFASNTFTAPVTGKYQFNAFIEVENVDIDSVYTFLHMQTSNRTYRSIIAPPSYDADLSYLTFPLSVLADMDAGDTAYLQMYQGGGAAQMDITASGRFSGYLVA